MSERPWYQRGPAKGEGAWAKEPRRVTPIGAAHGEPVGIYLGSEAMELVDEAIAASSDQTVTGLLLGHTLHSGERPFLLVTSLLTAPQTPHDDDLFFTPSQLDDLEKDWAQSDPESIVVGWFHGRPGRGAQTISLHERQTHERFFTAPWQIALLIDTHQKSSTLYQWRGVRLEPCEAFYFWNTHQEPPATLLETPEPPTEIVFQTAATLETAPAAPARASKLPARRRWLWIALGVFLIYLLIPGAPGSLSWMRAEYAENRDELKQLEQSLTTLQQETTTLESIADVTVPIGSESANSLQESLEPGASRSEATESSSQTENAQKQPAPSSELEFGESSDAAQESTSSGQGAEATNGVAATTGASQPATESSALNSTGPLLSQRAQEGSAASATDPRNEYVIQEGDTMWRISSDLLGSPTSYRSLAEQNDIEDPDRIFPGQRLQVP